MILEKSHFIDRNRLISPFPVAVPIEATIYRCWPAWERIV